MFEDGRAVGQIEFAVVVVGLVVKEWFGKELARSGSREDRSGESRG